MEFLGARDSLEALVLQWGASEFLFSSPFPLPSSAGAEQLTEIRPLKGVTELFLMLRHLLSCRNLQFLHLPAPLLAPEHSERIPGMA